MSPQMEDSDWRLLRFERDLASLNAKVDGLQASAVALQLGLQQSYIPREEYERRHKEIGDDVRGMRRLLDRGTWLLVATLGGVAADLILRLVRP